MNKVESNISEILKRYKNCSFLKWVKKDEELLIKINKKLTLTNIRKEYFIFLKSIINEGVAFKNNHFDGFTMYLSIFNYINSYSDEKEIKKLYSNFFKPSNIEDNEKETMNLIFLEPILKKYPEFLI